MRTPRGVLTESLRAGLDADLFLVGGDPTTDITAIRDVRAVVSRGRVVNLAPGAGTQRARGPVAGHT